MGAKLRKKERAMMMHLDLEDETGHVFVKREESQLVAHLQRGALIVF
jgi:hypothetical protein